MINKHAEPLLEMMLLGGKWTPAAISII